MAYCPTCGEEVGEAQRFCANCGTKLMGAHAAAPQPRGVAGGGPISGDGFGWNAGADPGSDETGRPAAEFGQDEVDADDFFASYRRKDLAYEGDEDGAASRLPRSRRRFDPDLSYPPADAGVAAQYGAAEDEDGLAGDEAARDPGDDAYAPGYADADDAGHADALAPAEEPPYEGTGSAWPPAHGDDAGFDGDAAAEYEAFEGEPGVAGEPGDVAGEGFSSEQHQARDAGFDEDQAHADAGAARELAYAEDAEGPGTHAEAYPLDDPGYEEHWPAGGEAPAYGAFDDGDLGYQDGDEVDPTDRMERPVTERVPAAPVPAAAQGEPVIPWREQQPPQENAEPAPDPFARPASEGSWDGFSVHEAEGAAPEREAQGMHPGARGDADAQVPGPYAGPPARYAGPPPAVRAQRPPERADEAEREAPPRAFDDVLHGETPTGTLTDVGDRLIRSRDFDQTGIVPMPGQAQAEAPGAARPGRDARMNGAGQGGSPRSGQAAGRASAAQPGRSPRPGQAAAPGAVPPGGVAHPGGPSQAGAPAAAPGAHAPFARPGSHGGPGAPVPPAPVPPDAAQEGEAQVSREEHGPVDEEAWERQLAESRERALAERAAAAAGTSRAQEDEWRDDEEAATQLFFLPSGERSPQQAPAAPQGHPAPRQQRPSQPPAPPHPRRDDPAAGTGLSLGDLDLDDEPDAFDAAPGAREREGWPDDPGAEPRTAAMPAPPPHQGGPRQPGTASRPGSAHRPGTAPRPGGAHQPGGARRPGGAAVAAPGGRPPSGPAGAAAGGGRLDDTSRRRLLTIIIAVCGALLLIVSSVIIANSLRSRGGDPPAAEPSESQQAEEHPPTEEPSGEAGPPAAVADPNFQTARFENESGNLRCVVSPQHGVACQHSNPTHVPPAEVCSSTGATGSVVGLDSNGYTYPCLTANIDRGLPKLDFDTPLQVGEFTCSINYMTGVTCRNAAGDSISLENEQGVTTNGRTSVTPQPTFDPQAV